MSPGWTDWLRPKGQALGGRGTGRLEPLQAAIAEAKRRENGQRPVHEQLAFAMRAAESPVPIDRMTVPLHLDWGSDKIKELAAQIKLSPYLRHHLQAIVHRFREDQRDLNGAEAALTALADRPEWAPSAEGLAILRSLFPGVEADAAILRDYPLLAQLLEPNRKEMGVPVPPELAPFVLGTWREESEEENEEGPTEPEAFEAMLEARLAEPLLPVRLMVGGALVSHINALLGGELIGHEQALRLALAEELGLRLPPVVMGFGEQLEPQAYRILVRGVVVAEGQVMPGAAMALATAIGEDAPPLMGFACQDPRTGRPATWVHRNEGRRAQAAGVTVLAHDAVVARHLEAVVRRHASQLFTIDDAAAWLESVRPQHPLLIEAVVPDRLDLASVHAILRRLLAEGVGIRDPLSILEALASAVRPAHPMFVADAMASSKAEVEKFMLLEVVNNLRPLSDPAMLAEVVRRALAPAICSRLAGSSGVIDVVAVGSALEHEILSAVEIRLHGPILNLPLSRRDALAQRLALAASDMERPAFLCGGSARRWVRELVSRVLPLAPVLAHEELDPGFTVHSVRVATAIDAQG